MLFAPISLKSVCIFDKTVWSPTARLEQHQFILCNLGRARLPGHILNQLTNAQGYNWIKSLGLDFVQLDLAVADTFTSFLAIYYPCRFDKMVQSNNSTLDIPVWAWAMTMQLWNRNSYNTAIWVELSVMYKENEQFKLISALGYFRGNTWGWC